MLNEVFVYDDALVSQGTAHVMHITSTGNHLVGFNLFPTDQMTHPLIAVAVGHRYVCLCQNGALGISFRKHPSHPLLDN